MLRKIVLCALVGLACGCGDESGSQTVRSSPSRSSPDESPARVDAKPVILFLGTSLTAGLGVPEEDAYPAVVQGIIDSAGLDYHVVNAGVSGETSAGGLRRIDWLLRQPVSVLVIELGANDALRGQDIAVMRDNLQEIIDRTRAAYPTVKIVIAGMQAPPNLGSSYATSFREAFVDLARINDAARIPFLLEGVGGLRKLNQSDGIHPTVEGHRILARNVWEVLEGVLRRSSEPGAGSSRR